MVIKIEGLTGSRLEVTSGYGKFGRQLQLLLNPENKTGDCFLWISPPYKRELSSGFNVIFTMHETDSLNESKKDWIDNLNQYNLIIVPTNWNKKVFLNLGVKKPIEVIPLGVDTNIFKGPKDNLFTILTMHDNFGRDSSRENWKETLEAYIETFKGVSEVNLVIKTWNYRKGALDESINEICQRLKIHIDITPLIVILDEKLTDVELNDLYSKAHLFIKNANREGWSLPLNEALSAGITCIYRSLPSLGWVNHYRAMPFSNADQLKGLMMYYYKEYVSVKKIREHYDIRRTAKLTGEIIRKYYESQ